MVDKHISHSIDIIRGLAALGVIWGHSIYGFDLPLELNGAFWVWIFLPISGYLIGKGFVDQRYELDAKGYKTFIYNRALRIIPLYQIALVLGVVLEQFAHSETTDTQSIVRQLTLSTSQTTLAGPLWTVTAEVHFYLVSILIVALIIKIQKPVFMVVLMLLSIGVAGLYNGLYYDAFAQPRTLVGNLHFFVFGMVLSTPYCQAPYAVPRNLKVLGVAGLVAMAWCIQNWHPEYFWRFGDRANKYIPLGGASLIAMLVVMVVLCLRIRESAISSRTWSVVKPLARMLGWCGVYTYGIYVWHSVLIKLNQSVVQVPVGLGRLCLLLFAIPVAVMSYRFIEAPLLRFKMASGYKG